jgi:hypothetical protein
MALQLPWGVNARSPCAGPASLAGWAWQGGTYGPCRDPGAGNLRSHGRSAPQAPLEARARGGRCLPKLGLELDSLEHLVGVGRMTSQRVTSMGAACIASAGDGMRTGTAAAMTIYPSSGLRLVSGVRAKPEGDLGRDRPWCALDQAALALPVHLQSEGPARLVSHPRVSQATDISATRKVQSDMMTLQPESPRLLYQRGRPCEPGQVCRIS